MHTYIFKTLNKGLVHYVLLSFSVPAWWAEPQQPGQQSGRSALPGEQAGVREARVCHRGAKLSRLLTSQRSLTPPILRVPPSQTTHPPPPFVFGMLPSLNQQKQLSDFSLHALYIHLPLHRFYFAARRDSPFFYPCVPWTLPWLSFGMDLWDSFTCRVASFTGMIKVDVLEGFWPVRVLVHFLSPCYFSQREREKKKIPQSTLDYALSFWLVSWAVLHAW